MTTTPVAPTSPKRLGWVGAVISLEMRRLFSYRVDFWVSFVGVTLTQLAIAFFLWRAVFAEAHTAQIRGYTFDAMMLYYLLVPLVANVVAAAESGDISREIYEGTLTRYLVYPLPYFTYKFVTQLASSLVNIVQCGFALGIFLWLFGRPVGVALTPSSVALGLITALGASYLAFAISSLIEMTAFWADNVWSLLSMQGFIARLLGGAMIPLALFPTWSQPWLARLPFAYLASFPIRVTMGQVDPKEWWLGIGIMAAWSVAFTGLAHLVWRRGTRQYSGVGI